MKASFLGGTARYSQPGSAPAIGIGGCYRIEPGEIEAVLLDQSGVAAAAVVVRAAGSDERQLAAYVVPEARGSLDRATLRASLRTRLPDHMTPPTYTELDALPLTRIRAEFDVFLPVMQLFENPTPERLGEEVERSKDDPNTIWTADEMAVEIDRVWLR